MRNRWSHSPFPETVESPVEVTAPTHARGIHWQPHASPREMLAHEDRNERPLLHAVTL